MKHKRDTLRTEFVFIARGSAKHVFTDSSRINPSMYLDKLKVLHVFAFYELLDGNNFVHSIFVEAVLEMFEVGDVVCFKLCVEFHLLDGNCS